jgi:hypothetical protein
MPSAFICLILAGSMLACILCRRRSPSHPLFPSSWCSRRLGGFEIDDEFELGRLNDRQIGWLLALEMRPA